MDLEKWLDSLLIGNRPCMAEAIRYLGDIFPMLKEYENTPQDPIWHGEGNVYIHTNLVLSELYSIFDSGEFVPNASQTRILILSAILHDIGKPITTVEKDGRIKAPKHEKVGLSYLIFKLLNLKLPKTEYNQILNLVGYHQAPKLAVIRDEDPSYYYYLSTLFDYKLMYFLEKADLKGRICDDMEENLMYLDEYLSKTEETLERIKRDSLHYRAETYLEKMFCNYYLSTGAINSPLETPQKVFKTINDHFYFTMLVGIPGVGKSTFIEKYFPHTYKISTDEIREQLSFRSDQSRNNEVFIIAKDLLKKALREKRNIVWDATNLREEFRKPLLNLAEAYGAVNRIYILTDTEENIRYRNKNRAHVVPEDVMDRMFKNFDVPTSKEAPIVLTIDMNDIKK